MATFDIAQQRMCVRVVYDGAASAGKTTNLRHLAELFASQRTCELYSPAEMDGRTLYFDWLQIAAGMVCGFPLVCQVITVPGQVVLTPRRRHLLSGADVVVHVCDSDAQAAARAAEGLGLLAQVEEERGETVPLVIQANKQDQPGALAGAALLAALERHDVPVVEAIASDGVGVVDTFVAAVRAAVRSIQSRVESGKVKVAVDHAETADEVLEKLAAQRVDPEWAVEMMLEEASNALAFAEPGAEAPPNAPPAEMLAAAPCPNHLPTLPTEHVPTGFVWPAHTGRAVLRALEGEPEMRAPVTLDAEGVATVEAGEYLLTTRQERRFETAEAARQALVRAARERTQLGALLAPETVLVAQPGGDGATWLWRILPRMPTVAELVASPERPEPLRAALLTVFGEALAEALRLEAQIGVTLDLSPASFGVRQGAVRYLGAVSVETVGRDVGRALTEALVSLASLSDTLEPAVHALESAITVKLSPEELAKLAHGATWRDPSASSPVLRDARTRIEEAFNRNWKAA
ncbi:MAG TPA: GTPase domain-containing protein [Polyangiaceae bacterium]|jgi:hypothetical protein